MNNPHNSSSTAMDGNSSLADVNTTLFCTSCTSNLSKPLTNSTHNCTALCATSVAFYIIIITTSLCGNVLVVYAFAVNKKIRQSVTTYFIVSLAISDLFTASVVMPFDLEQLLTNYKTWRHGPLMCSIWTALYLLMVPTSILNLLVLTIDRYKTLSDPLNRFKESPFMTKNRALLIITLLWVYCLLFALIPLMGWQIYPDVIMNGICVFNISPIYSMLSSVLNFFIPLVSMCCLHFQIYRIAMGFNTLPLGRMTPSPVTIPRPKHKYAAQNGMTSSSIIIRQKMLLRNTRAAKTVLVIVCTFVLCWMPYTIFSFVNAACISCYYTEETATLSPVFMIMGYANSALNPFIFGLTHRLFKKTFKRLFNNMFSKCQRHRPSQSRLSLPSRSRSIPNSNLLGYRITQSGSIHLFTTIFTTSPKLNLWRRSWGTKTLELR